jgi:DNA-binding NarL/FixJ family response regulator
MINILLVDDHIILRNGLKIILDLDPNLKVVGEANSVKDAISFVKIAEKLDVVITGMNLPNESGLELIEFLNTSFPSIKSLIFSRGLECPYITKAMELGASGYIKKNCEDYELIYAIMEVCAGNIFFSPTTEEQVSKCKESESDTFINLTVREQEVLKYIVEGMSNKMIADKIYVSESTVNTHRYHIMKKLNAKNSADLVRIFFSSNLLISN